MKVDLVMWTKNGQETLPRVLDNIEAVVPCRCVNQKVIVDDHSRDDTKSIAESFGWRVVPNKGTGISNGANTALNHVESDYFVSLEQDLLLCRDWWNKIPTYLEKRDVAVASGMRFANKPIGLMKLQRYVAKKYRGEKRLCSWLRRREMAAFTLGKTLDNTIYKTDKIRACGGFPKMQVNAGVDAVLAYKIMQASLRWIVDYNVQSVHIRKGLRDELKHQYWYGRQLRNIWRKLETETNTPPPLTMAGTLYRLFISPFTGLFIALKTKEPSVTYTHPLIKFYYFKGLLEGEQHG